MNTAQAEDSKESHIESPMAINQTSIKPKPKRSRGTDRRITSRLHHLLLGFPGAGMRYFHEDFFRGEPVKCLSVTNIQNCIGRINRNNSSVDLDQIKFGISCLEYRALLVDCKGFQLNKRTRDSFRRCLVPINMHRLRQYLTSVYECNAFIPNAAELLQPLECLCRDGIQFEWGAPQQAVFDQLNQLIINSPTLKEFDTQLKSEVHLTFGPQSVGAILYQIQESDQNSLTLCPVTHVSRAFTNDQMDAVPSDQELYKLWIILDKLRFFLYDQNFILVVDNIELIDKYQTAITRYLKPFWLQKLERFKFQIIYRSPSQN